jgi:dTDP-4-amino-4,6-dideoxygalactose transaminase
VIPITRPDVGDEEADAAGEVIRSGWLTQGARVQEFERVVADYVGAPEAIATSNCTTALHLALVVAGVGPGDEVICPSFSFIATANAIVHAGARPVFVDIDPLSLNIDPVKAEAAITQKTKAIMPVDQIGLAADVFAVREIARRYGLRVVEDAAPSLGAMVGEARLGSVSDFTCFSFHPRKSITTAEGGIITTADAEAAKRLRELRSHAASISDLARHQADRVEIEEYLELGYNYRMSDVHAAIGIVQMKKLDDILARRRRLAERYNELLAAVPGVETPYEPDGRPHTYQSYCVRLASQAGRDATMAAMAQRGVATRRGVMAIHLEPYYRSLYPELSLPETESASATTLLLPLFAQMTLEEQDFVVQSLGETLASLPI